MVKRRKKKEEKVEKKKLADNIKELTGMDFVSSARAAEDRNGLKGIVVKSSVVPQHPCKVTYIH